MDIAPLIFESESIQKQFREGYDLIKYAQVQRLNDGAMYVVKVLSLNCVEISRTFLKNVQPKKSSYKIIDTGARFDVEKITNIIQLGEKSEVQTYVVTHYEPDGAVFDVYDPSINKSSQQEQNCERLKQLMNTQENRYLEEMTVITRNLFPGTPIQMPETGNMIEGLDRSLFVEGDAFDFGAEAIKFYTLDKRLVINAYVPPGEKLQKGSAIPDVQKNVFGPFKAQT